MNQAKYLEERNGHLAYCGYFIVGHFGQNSNEIHTNKGFNFDSWAFAVTLLLIAVCFSGIH
jgi:hypothetical protein